MALQNYVPAGHHFGRSHLPGRPRDDGNNHVVSRDISRDTQSDERLTGWLGVSIDIIQRPRRLSQLTIDAVVSGA